VKLAGLYIVNQADFIAASNVLLQQKTNSSRPYVQLVSYINLSFCHDIKISLHLTSKKNSNFHELKKHSEHKNMFVELKNIQEFGKRLIIIFYKK
jgi:hypothetical protein